MKKSRFTESQILIAKERASTGYKKTNKGKE
jgi:hypothetical protein